MLSKFTVSNFKSFENEFTFNLSEINGYEFNTECIKNGIVNSAMIYGLNGSGKSNLALAIFDIIEHLTDKNRDAAMYSNYRNANCKSQYSTFLFEFIFNSKTVVYEYKKSDYKTIVYERFLIENQEFAFIDRDKSSHATIKFKGAETLKNEISNSELSILRYIKYNTELENNEDNAVFMEFFSFIEKMLFFRNLDDRRYFGLQEGTRNILEDIIENDNVKDFEEFLNEANVECRLEVVNEFDKRTIGFRFEEGVLPFSNVASTGTNALTLFYYWYQRIKNTNEVSFLFIDEFDAFYHHELSSLIVRKLKEAGVQFVLTTHNTSNITNDLLRPDCYFLMSKHTIRPLSKCTEKELREAHNIEKMYKANSFHVE